jgi:hypothetical protein
MGALFSQSNSRLTDANYPKLADKFILKNGKEAKEILKTEGFKIVSGDNETKTKTLEAKKNVAGYDIKAYVRVYNDKVISTTFEFPAQCRNKEHMVEFMYDYINIGYVISNYNDTNVTFQKGNNNGGIWLESAGTITVTVMTFP